MKLSNKKLIRAINEREALLVFPVKDKKEPPSLWSHFFPRSKMSWDWDVTGDDRVVDLWHLMKEISSSGEVIYSKWYQNRATFFSKKQFVRLLSHLQSRYRVEAGLDFAAKDILSLLRQDSPLSTKDIKKQCDLQGKIHEGLYNKAMKPLYQRGLIVGYGEKEDGSFPSAMMAASELVFEELVREAVDLARHEPGASVFRDNSAFEKHLQRIEKDLLPHN